MHVIEPKVARAISKRVRARRPSGSQRVLRVRCGTSVPPVQLDASDLSALLSVVRAQTVAELEREGARLRSLLGAAANDLEPHIAALRAKLVELERFKRLAATDVLTGLVNRRAFTQALRRELARAERSGSPLSVIMFDIDDFKVINDTCGHAVGDEMLRLFARCATAVTRQCDLVGRIGGDELMVLLPETDVAHARAIAERIRKDAAAASRALPRALGLSIGIAASSAGASVQAVMVAADREMYLDKAKRRVGRDKAVS